MNLINQKIKSALEVIFAVGMLALHYTHGTNDFLELGRVSSSNRKGKAVNVKKPVELFSCEDLPLDQTTYILS